MKINLSFKNKTNYHSFGKGQYFLYADFDRTLSPLTTADIFYANDKEKINKAKISFAQMTDILHRYKDKLSLIINTDRAYVEFKVMDELYRKQGISIPEAVSVIVKSGSEEWLHSGYSLGFPYFKQNKKRTNKILTSSKFKHKTIDNFAIKTALSHKMEPIFAMTTLSAEKYSPYSIFSYPQLLTPKSIIFRDIGALKLFYGFGDGIDDKNIEEFTKKIKLFLKEKNINCHFVENKKNPECGNLRTLMIMPIVDGTPLGKNHDVDFAIIKAKEKGDTVIAAGDSRGDYAMLNPLMYVKSLDKKVTPENIDKIMEYVESNPRIKKELLELPFIGVISKKEGKVDDFLKKIYSLFSTKSEYKKIYSCQEGKLPKVIEKIITLNDSHNPCVN